MSPDENQSQIAKNPALLMVRVGLPIARDELDQAKAKVRELTDKIQEYEKAERALIEAGIE
jgi:hypothetical protein